MIKIITNLFILLIIFSCSDKHEESLESLNHSFLKWNKKYSHNLYDIHLEKKLEYEKQFIGEIFYKDMKRFLMELNQIDQQKMSSSYKNDYLLLSKYLNYNIFNYEKMKDSDWNLIRKLDDIRIDILYLLALNEHDEIEIENLNKNIDFISSEINNIFDTIKYQYTNKSYIEMTDFLIVELEKLVSFSNFEKLKNDLKILQSWYKENYNKLNSLSTISLKPNYDKFIALQLGENLDLDSTVLLAEEMIENYQKDIFDFALPIYLSNNDEPVWTDYQDTLNVIDWMSTGLKNLSKINSDCFNESNILLSTSDFVFSELDFSNRELIGKIDFKVSSITDEPFYVYSHKSQSFIAFNYTKNSNPIKLYSNILEDLIPGDLFIDYSIKKTSSLINKVYNDISYSYPYKMIMIENYINFLLRANSLAKENKQCIQEYVNYAYMLGFQFDIDKIKNCIYTIAAIKHHYYDIDIDETINKYSYFNFFSDKEIIKMKLEIFGFKVDSIIKFKSYYLVNNIYNKIILEKKPEYFINILKDHPNVSFAGIRNIIQ